MDDTPTLRECEACGMEVTERYKGEVCPDCGGELTAVIEEPTTPSVSADTPRPPLSTPVARYVILPGIVVLLVVAGFAVFGGKKSSSVNDPVSYIPDSTAPTNETFAETLPPTTQAPTADSDVTMSKCALPDNAFEGPDATLSITNHSSERSSYFITVAFESPDGKAQLDTGNASVQSLAPGQTASADAVSLKSAIRGQPFTCKVVNVSRLARA